MVMRGSTPTQRFEIPFDTELLTEFNIYFAQDGETLLTKTMADCELEKNAILLELSREDTLIFNHKKTLEIQLDLNFGEKWIPSYIKYVDVGEFLGEG